MAILAASIRGGTGRTGIPREAFAVPQGLRIRYDLPSPRLRSFVSAYVVHASTGHDPASEWFLPTDAVIRIRLDGGATTLMTLEGRFDLSCASIVGPTSRAFRTTSHRGVLVSVGITPLGWTALTERRADAYLDRAVDLDDVTSGRFVTRLLDRLRIVSDESFLTSALDEALEPLLCHGEEAGFDVEAIHEALSVGHELPIAEIAAELDLPSRTLLTLSRTAFGMTPKLLFRRERFLQAFRQILMSGDSTTSVVSRSRYFDGSHFLRDARDFLGTTPRRFIAGGTTLQRATLLAERTVLTGRAAANRPQASTTMKAEEPARS